MWNELNPRPVQWPLRMKRSASSTKRNNVMIECHGQQDHIFPVCFHSEVRWPPERSKVVKVALSYEDAGSSRFFCPLPPPRLLPDPEKALHYPERVNVQPVRSTAATITFTFQDVQANLNERLVLTRVGLCNRIVDWFKYLGSFTKDATIFFFLFKVDCRYFEIFLRYLLSVRSLRCKIKNAGGIWNMGWILKWQKIRDYNHLGHFLHENSQGTMTSNDFECFAPKVQFDVAIYYVSLYVSLINRSTFPVTACAMDKCRVTSAVHRNAQRQWRLCFICESIRVQTH